MKENKKDTSDWALHPGTMLTDYKLIRPIGSSHRWIAYLAEDKKGRRCRLTFVDKTKILERFQFVAYKRGTPPEGIEVKATQHYHEYQQQMMKAVERVKGLSHENVAEIYECTYDREQDELVIISEYTPGVDLFYAATKLKPVQSLFLYAQVLEGLSFIHNNGLLHLNIKPSRIYVDIEAKAPSVKFTDFGFAVPIGEYEGGYRGSLFYMAPEVILEQKEKVDKRTDLFSFGVTMYYCLTGHQPLGERFIAQGDKHRLMSIVQREKGVETPPSHYNKDVPPKLDELVLGLLRKEPNQRSCDAAKDVLYAIYDQWPEESHELSIVGTSQLESYESYDE